MSVSYWDIFPDAKLSVEFHREDVNDHLEPKHIHDLILRVAASRGSASKIGRMVVSHCALAKHVYLIIFEGITQSIYNEQREDMKSFEKLAHNGFPVMVLSEEKNGFVFSAAKSVLGCRDQGMKYVEYKSYEEMLVDLRERNDNGFPVREIVDLGHPMRCTFFGMERLTEEELGHYSELPEKSEGAQDIISIDCEMITTKHGAELSRISVVSSDGTVLLDEFFKPKGEVVDYLTEKSGITEDILLKKAKYESDQCIMLLSKIADQHTIIVGHSLENDFRAMKLIHNRVIDTSILYSTKWPGKWSLAKLYAKYINKPFRVDPKSGHDSIEDARAAMELVARALGRKISKQPEPSLPPLFLELLKSLVRIDVVTYESEAMSYTNTNENIRIMKGNTCDELTHELIKISEPAPFTYFHTNTALSGDIKQECKKYDECLKQILESVQSQSIVIVYTGNRPLSAESAQQIQEFREGLVWVYTHT